MDKKLLKEIKLFIEESEKDFWYPHSHEVSKLMRTKAKCEQGFPVSIEVKFKVIGLNKESDMEDYTEDELNEMVQEYD